jgi:hypothetical protein
MAIAAVALRLAGSRQARTIATSIGGLEDRARLERGPRPAPDALAALPEPVLRYLNQALPPPVRGLRLVRYRQQGTLRADPGRERWMRFAASQVIGPRTTEFLWTARVEIAPFLHLRVTDAFLAGYGSGQVALLSAVPLASASGNHAMNSGSLHRFLAEAVWCPSALLPSPQLAWTPIDGSRAVATLAKGATTVSLEFRFNAADEVEGIYTPARWGSFGGRYQQVAWEGKFRRYARRYGVLVPSEGEVGWYSDARWRSVWRGTVVSAYMEFD